jgi:NAD(P)-dependent dehydrogenase (short-subunit alcohol dehydrogenase family)
VNVVHIFSFDRGAPWFVHSGAARAGVVSMTRSMGPYLGYHGVTINALAPGTIGTPGMHENEVGQLGYSEDEWAVQAEAIGPMRRMGTVEEMAGIILFLCSPAARFVNGAAIVADGSESQSNWPRFFDRGEL